MAWFDSFSIFNSAMLRAEEPATDQASVMKRSMWNSRRSTEGEELVELNHPTDHRQIATRFEMETSVQEAETVEEAEESEVDQMASDNAQANETEQEACNTSVEVTAEEETVMEARDSGGDIDTAAEENYVVEPISNDSCNTSDTQEAVTVSQAEWNTRNDEPTFEEEGDEPDNRNPNITAQNAEMDDGDVALREVLERFILAKRAAQMASTLDTVEGADETDKTTPDLDQTIKVDVATDTDDMEPAENAPSDTLLRLLESILINTTPDEES